MSIALAIAQRQGLRARGLAGFGFGLMPGASPQRQLALGHLGYYPGASPQRQLVLGVYPSPDNSDAVASAISAFANTVDTYKAQIGTINSRMYSLAQSVGGSAGMSAWSSWHSAAVDWENYGGVVVSQLQQLAAQGILTQEGWATALAQDQSGVLAAEFYGTPSSASPAQTLVSDYINQGTALLQGARASMAAITYDDSLASAISTTLGNLPGQVQNALNVIIKAAGGAITTATIELLKPILLVVGVAVGLLFLLKRAGVKVDYGPVKFNGYNSGTGRRGTKRQRRRGRRK